MSLLPSLSVHASPALRAWIARRASAVESAAAEAVGCLAFGEDVIYDSEGRRYPARYHVVAANLDGRSTLAVSHSPRDFSWTPGYPPEFQTRDLGSPEESAKIATIARGLDATRLLGRNLDATLGAPVVWRGADDRLYVLGGNGRAIGFLRAPEDRYQHYLREARCRWPDRFPGHAAPAGHRWLMVRELVGDVSEQQAAQVAAASQRSTAAEEGRIGRALGLFRSLQVDASRLGSVRWARPIAIDNAEEFYTSNRGFVDGVLAGMDPAQRSHYLNDNEKMAQLVSALFLGFLPASLRRSGMFDNPRVEDALVGALPAIVTSASLAVDKEIHAGFDLLTVLPEAIDVFQAIRRMRLSFDKLAQVLDAERRTARIPGVPRVSDAPNLALALAAALYNASRRAAPEVAVSDILAAYIAEASRYNPRQGGMFGAATFPDPAVVLAGVVPGFKLPGSEAEAEPARLFNSALVNRGRTAASWAPALRRAEAALARVPALAGATLPALAWGAPFTVVNVAEAARSAPSFVTAVVRLAGLPDTASAEEVVGVLDAAMLGKLTPISRALLRERDRGVQAAIMALLPVAWHAHQEAASGRLDFSADPWARIDAALRLIAHGASEGDDALTAVLARVFVTSVPVPVKAAVLARYVALAAESGPRQGRMFSPAPDPSSLLKRAWRDVGAG